MERSQANQSGEKMRTVNLLDATLRDGGLGLEDSFQKGYSDVVFGANDRDQILANLIASKIDIIEIGSIEKTEEDKRKFAIYKSIEQASGTIPTTFTQTHFAALYRGPDTPSEEIPPYNASLCELVRVILRYSELKKSLDFCHVLSGKGYKVCVQPMLTMRYTQDELRDVVSAANDMDAFALYFVDSYGYMEESDIKRFTDFYASNLKSSVRIGFHAHNNMNLAFSNARAFLDLSKDRDVVLDSCAMGLGQGAGNLQTELIADFLIKNCGKQYSFDSILDVCEIVDRLCPSGQCGYSVTCQIPAMHRAAYKYAFEMRNKYKMSFRDINKVYRCMPYDLKQRYTPENLSQALAIAR